MHLQLEVLAVAVSSTFSAEAVQLLASALQVELQELIRPCQLNHSAESQLNALRLTAEDPMQAGKQDTLMGGNTHVPVVYPFVCQEKQA